MPSRHRARFDVECLERRDCPAVVTITADQPTVREAGGTATLTVRLDAPDTKPVTVGWAVGGDATLARDYRLAVNGQGVSTSGSLTFKPRETVKTIVVAAVDDLLREGDERFSVSILPIQNATIGAQRTATVTVVDDDNYTAALSGPTRIQPGQTASFRLSLSSPATASQTFYVSTIAGSAAAGSDFRPLTNLPVIFNRGESSKSFPVTILANAADETDETFVLRAEPAVAGFPPVTPFAATIAGNGAAPAPSLSVAAASVIEGNSGTATAVFRVSLSAPSAAPVTVAYATADGTATTADLDYEPVASPQVLTFAPGETVKTVTVPVNGDTKVESDETFSLVLSDPTNATLGTATAIGTIRNDDSVTPPVAQGSWTIMVYMTGENLNRFARDDINEMERFLATLPADSGVSIVVSWDQPKASAGTAYATGNGAQAAWRSYGRSLLAPDTSATIASTFDLSFGEKNTGDPATLVDFMKWGAQRAPATNYALQMWGHGGGLDGSQFDSESAGDPLTIGEIAQALGTSGVPAVQLVSYDNCLMAMAEVGYAVAQRFSGHFVASEELVNGTGQNYVTAYSALATTPASKTSADIAGSMVASYQAQYGGQPPEDTFSAVATGGYTQLASALAQFVNATDPLDATQRTTIRNLVTTAPSLSFDVTSFRDLGGFMARVAAATGLPQAVRNAATTAGTAIAAMVSGKTNDGRSSSGIAIYLPTASDSYLSTYATTAAAFCNATGWDRFARWLATGSRAALAGVPAAAATPRSSWASGPKALLESPGTVAAAQWAAYAATAEQSTTGRGRGRSVTSAAQRG